MSMTPSELQAAAENYLTRLIDNVEWYQVMEAQDDGVSDEDVDRICYLVWNSEVSISEIHVRRSQTYRYR